MQINNTSKIINSNTIINYAGNNNTILRKTVDLESINVRNRYIFKVILLDTFLLKISNSLETQLIQCHKKGRVLLQCKIYIK